jgi:glycosyltransferase involved in cell wall biosynthesis
MSRPSLFAVHLDATKTTSGQRFYRDLRIALSRRSIPLDEQPNVVLFNVSAPLSAILRAKLRGQRVVLRIDGLYCDRLSLRFLAAMPAPLSGILRLGLKFPGLHDACAFVANLYDRNYGSFIRILLANFVIYQSEYARTVHSRFFPKKANQVIVNGSRVLPSSAVSGPGDDAIRVVTICDEWRASKRLGDLVRFARWAREERKVPVHLTILGYSGALPPCDAENLRRTIETTSWINTLPRFADLSGPFGAALDAADVYMTFTFRDSCPNTVIESMAHGLPVVGLGSGGLPDIVGDAGHLTAANDFAGGFYAAARYECEFPPIDFEEVLSGLLDVHSRLSEYRARVRRRFEECLDIERVAERYAAVLETC